jgi:hypothetical protein
MRVSSALGMIGSADCFLNAVLSVIGIDAFLQEFGSVDSKFYVQGIVCLIAGILGVFGILRRATLGATLMFGSSMLMFFALGLFGWFPCIFLFASGIMALRERESTRLENNTFLDQKHNINSQ